MSDHDPFAPKMHRPDASEARKADQDASDPLSVDVAPKTEPAPSVSVPDGSVKEVNDWVGDDKERAQAALDAEGEDGRKGIINYAKSVLDQ